MNLIEALNPKPMSAYFTPKPAINEEHFREWVEHKVNCVRCITPEEWTQLEAEYRDEHRIGG